MFRGVLGVFRGCSEGVPGCSRCVPWCSEGVPGCSRCVPWCSVVFRGVPGFTDTPFKMFNFCENVSSLVET